MASDVLLVHPPFWDPYAPPASTPALLGHLRANEVPSVQIDLNERFFRSEYGRMLGAAAKDLIDPIAFEQRVPHEHKVVLGGTNFDPRVFDRHGIDPGRLDVAAHKAAIGTWEIGRLNALDALVHYGYFVRHQGDAERLLESHGELSTGLWRNLRAVYDVALLPLLQRERPLVVGFSILGEQQLAATVACSAWLREDFDGVLIWGGSDIRYSHERMSRPASWWRDLPDFICLGEGESALLGLARRAREVAVARSRAPGWAREVRVARRPRDPTHIPGLLERPGQSKMLPAKRYEVVKTLAQYDFDGFALHEGYLMPSPIVPYQGSRGCHWGICAFCDHEEGYRLHYRPKAVAQVVDHMEHMRDAFGVTHLQFVDEAIEPVWLRELNGELEARGLDGVFRWSNYSKIAKSLTPELLARSRRNGCRLILFGVESFNQRLLGLVRKGIHRREIMRTLHDTHGAGIHAWVWLISGLPTETPDEVRQNIADLRSLSGVVQAASVGRYRISANSDIYRETDTFGIVSYDLTSPMEVQYELGGEPVDIKEVARLFYEEYYPTAVSMSLSHNRYLLFQDALRGDCGRNAVRAPVGPRAEAALVHGGLAQAASQAGLGNV